LEDLFEPTNWFDTSSWWDFHSWSRPIESKVDEVGHHRRNQSIPGKKLVRNNDNSDDETYSFGVWEWFKCGMSANNYETKSETKFFAEDFFGYFGYFLHEFCRAQFRSRLVPRSTEKLPLMQKETTNRKQLLWSRRRIVQGRKIQFPFKIGSNYPHESPKVKCMTKMYHLNIDVKGNACLDIVREDWKSAPTINSFVHVL